MSQNKTTKYFKYAIGEIILVVIGILIALSINNWNDARKEKNELHQYLAKISNNIELDIKNLKEIKERRTSTNQACKKALANFQENEFDLYTNLNASNVFIDFYFIPNQSGYEALKNSSYLGKINGTKVDSLIDAYNTVVNKTIKEESGYFGFVENMEVLWTSKFDMSKLLHIYMSQTQVQFNELDIDLQKKLKEAFSDETYRSTVTRGAIQTITLTYYDNLVETGNELIKEIDSVIND